MSVIPALQASAATGPGSETRNVVATAQKGATAQKIRLLLSSVQMAPFLRRAPVRAAAPSACPASGVLEDSNTTVQQRRSAKVHGRIASSRARRAHSTPQRFPLALLIPPSASASLISSTTSAASHPTPPARGPALHAHLALTAPKGQRRLTTSPSPRGSGGRPSTLSKPSHAPSMALALAATVASSATVASTASTARAVQIPAIFSTCSDPSAAPATLSRSCLPSGSSWHSDQCWESLCWRAAFGT